MLPGVLLVRGAVVSSPRSLSAVPAAVQLTSTNKTDVPAWQSSVVLNEELHAVEYSQREIPPAFDDSVAGEVLTIAVVVFLLTVGLGLAILAKQLLPLYTLLRARGSSAASVPLRSSSADAQAELGVAGMDATIDGVESAGEGQGTEMSERL